MAGMELDLEHIRGAPVLLALRGWVLSLLLGVAAAALLSETPLAREPLMLTLALCTTALGTLLPMLRDAGQLGSDFGRMFLAAGTVGEVAPILAMSLLLSQEFGFLLLFLVLVTVAAAAGMGLRPPLVVALLNRTLHASTQLPVRVSLFILAGFFVLTEEFGFENILVALGAGWWWGWLSRAKRRSRCDTRSTPCASAGSFPSSSSAPASSSTSPRSRRT